MAEQVGRKLAAILVSDVVGYSRLAGRDEELTLARLRALRSDLIDPIIAVHRGRVVKRTGDGALVEFRSVVDAVRCAIEVQTGLVERNAGLPPERKIEFRIGIHLGDVMEEADGDLMGDGVNIAARLETMCAPGGVALSEDAYRQVRNRLDLAVTDLGDQALKNIAEPVRVYALTVGQPATARAAPQTYPSPPHSSFPSPPLGGEGRVRGAAPSQPTSPSLSPQGAERGKRSVAIPVIAGIAALILIAAVAAWYFVMRPGANLAANAPAHLSIVVLPFANLSGDPKQDYFADGITDNLTTDLSRIRNSFVIARNTAFTYKGKNVDAKEIGKELDVRYVLEGSVQRDGNRVRVNAQLIDAESGAHLWADRFEEDLADLFKLQDDVVARLARALQIELVRAENEKGLSDSRQSPDVTDLNMRGWALLWQPLARDTNLKALDLFNEALKREPNNADALVGVAYADTRKVAWGWADPKTDPASEAANLLARALAINPDYAFAYYVKSILLFITKQSPHEIRAAAQKAFEFNPNLAPAFFAMGEAEISLHQWDDAVRNLKTAIRLSPRDPQVGLWHMGIGVAYIGAHRQDEAIDELHAAIDAGFRPYVPYAMLASAYALSGRAAEAKPALANARAKNPAMTSVKWYAAHNPQDPPEVAEGLRMAGLPEDEPQKHLSIVVLPFTNLSGDPKQDYFADGITDNLTTDLSRIRNSFVIARNTAFTYKGKNLDAKEIGKELGVRYVLEGSVARDGNRVRVNAQLIDAESGAHLWADRFEEDLSDLFKLQDDVVARLANTLGYELVKAEAEKSAHSTNPDAIDLTMQGWALYWGHEIDKAATEAARNLFARALKLDPSNDDALAGIAYMNFRSFFYGWGDSSVDYDAKVIVPADRAVALNPANAKAYYAKSIYLAESKRPNDALVTAEAGLGNDPNFAALHFARAVAAVAVGRYEPARADIAQAMKLSPRDPQTGVWDILLGGVDIAVGNDNAAIEDERKALQAGYHAYLPHAYLASAYALLGKEQEAAAELADARRINPKLTIKWALAHTIDAPRFYDGLRKAGLPEDEVPKLSIVVLPFENLSGDAKQDYLADVLTDELTTYISRIPGSFVIARNTAFTYKGKPTDVKEIGKDLGVRYALEGSVQPTDKRIRTNAQLIDTETGAHLWAEEFDTDKTDLLETEDDIVTRLARTLQLQLADIEAARLEHSRPSNPGAQELALRCAVIFDDLASFIGKEADAASQLCERALQADPNNVIALATLAHKYSWLVSTLQTTDLKADLAHAEELTERALAIEPTNPMAIFVRAHNLMVEGRLAEAHNAAERALALSPTLMDAYVVLDLTSLFAGEAEKVIETADKAIRLSPRDPQMFIFLSHKGSAYFMLKRYDEAIDLSRQSIALNPAPIPTYFFLIAALTVTGHDAEARETLARYLSSPGVRTRTVAAYKRNIYNDNPTYRAMRERLYEGLRKAGMAEQ